MAEYESSGDASPFFYLPKTVQKETRVLVEISFFVLIIGATKNKGPSTLDMLVRTLTYSHTHQSMHKVKLKFSLKDWAQYCVKRFNGKQSGVLVSGVEF